MAARKKKDLKSNELHTCGECGWGKFLPDHSNLDINGKPICLECPYTENRKRIRSERACDRWKPNNEKK